MTQSKEITQAVNAIFNAIDKNAPDMPLLTVTEAFVTTVTVALAKESQQRGASFLHDMHLPSCENNQRFVKK
jgi:hypothetical protein